MSGREILYSVDNRVATVTLHRPDRLNAWTGVMEEEFTGALRTAAGNPEVRVIVVTGAGRAFCAGADMSLLDAASRAGSAVAGHQRLEVGFGPEPYRKRYAWMLGIPKPIVAAVHGPAVGLGFVILLYCDFRLASSDARFSSIFARRGLIAEYGLAWLLPHLVGWAHAVDILLTGRMIGAAEAHRIGLVHRLYEPETYAAEVAAFARDLADGVSPRSLAVMKEQMLRALEEPLGASLDRAFREMQASLASEDFREGVAHFLEKRSPAFRGK